MHKFTALLNELKVPNLNTDGRNFHRRKAARRLKRPTELISFAARNYQSQLTECSWSSSITGCHKMIQIPIHRVVHPVINLIEQTQIIDHTSVGQTTKLPAHNRSALTTIQSSKSKWDYTEDIHTGAKYSKLDKTYALINWTSALPNQELSGAKSELPGGTVGVCSFHRRCGQLPYNLPITPPSIYTRKPANVFTCAF